MTPLTALPIVSRLTERLAISRSGRVTLHLFCMLAGSDLLMHWQGIARELLGQ